MSGAEPGESPLDALDPEELLAVARGDAEVRSTAAWLWDLVSPLLLFASGGFLLWAGASGSGLERAGIALGVFLIAYGVSSWVENDAVEQRIDALVELLERRHALPGEPEQQKQKQEPEQR